MESLPHLLYRHSRLGIKKASELSDYSNWFPFRRRRNFDKGTYQLLRHKYLFWATFKDPNHFLRAEILVRKIVFSPFTQHSEVSPPVSNIAIKKGGGWRRTMENNCTFFYFVKAFVKTSQNFPLLNINGFYAPFSRKRHFPLWTSLSFCYQKLSWHCL